MEELLTTVLPYWTASCVAVREAKKGAQDPYQEAGVRGEVAESEDKTVPKTVEDVGMLPPTNNFSNTPGQTTLSMSPDFDLRKSNAKRVREIRGQVEYFRRKYGMDFDEFFELVESNIGKLLKRGFDLGEILEESLIWETLLDELRELEGWATGGLRSQFLCFSVQF